MKNPEATYIYIYIYMYNVHCFDFYIFYESTTHVRHHSHKLIKRKGTISFLARKLLGFP